MTLGARYISGGVTSKSGANEAGARVYVDFTDGGTSIRKVSVTTDASGFYYIAMNDNKQGSIYAESADGQRKSPTVAFDITKSNAALPGLVLP